MPEHQHSSPQVTAASARPQRHEESAVSQLDELVQCMAAGSRTGARATPGMLTPAAILALQRTAGNGAVNQLLHQYAVRRDPGNDAAAGVTAVQRDPGDGVACAVETAPRTDTPAPTDAPSPGVSAPSGSGTTTAPVVPEAKFLDKAAAQKALTAAFGDIRVIDAGKVEVLKQAEFQVAYDKIYGASQYSWALYIKPGPGNLEGFAYDNTNYINEDCISYDTVPHEMLHNNTAADWRGVVGNEFDEGTTEHLTIAAMAKLGKTPSHSYPDQESCVKAVVAAGVSEDSLKTAYLKGGAQTLVADVITANCTHTWAEVKEAMQEKDFAKAKTLLVKK